LLEEGAAALPFGHSRQPTYRPARAALLRVRRAGGRNGLAVVGARPTRWGAPLADRPLGARRAAPRPAQWRLPGRMAAPPRPVAGEPAAANLARPPRRARRADRVRA